MQLKLFFAAPSLQQLADSPRPAKMRLNKKRRRCVGKYVFNGVLGTSEHTEVVRVVKGGKAGEEFALKRLKRTRDEARLRREISAHLRCHAHPHITTCHDFMQDKDNFFLVTELAYGGDVFTRFEHHHAPVPESQIVALFRQLVNAVHHMHSHGVAHRDLKPENVLLRDMGFVMVCDFGSVACWEPGDDNTCTDVAGTVCYMPPEVVKSQLGESIEYDPCAVDVWGCGIVLHFMLTGQRYFGHDDSQAIRKILAHATPIPMPDFVSVEAGKLVNDLLHPNPKQRPTIPQVVERLRSVQSPPMMRRIRRNRERLLRSM